MLKIWIYVIQNRIYITIFTAKQTEKNILVFVEFRSKISELLEYLIIQNYFIIHHSLSVNEQAKPLSFTIMW